MRLVNKLNLDSPKLVSEHGSWSYAKNIQISDKGDYSENEDATVEDYKYNNGAAQYIGKIVLPDDVLLFYYIDTTNGYLDIIRKSTNKKIRIHDTRYKHQTIHGDYTFNYKGELIFNVGCRNTSANSPELVIINWEENEDETITMGSKEYDNILLNRNWFKKSYPQIVLNSIDKTGSLLSGVYMLSLCYEDRNGNRSDFISPTNKIIITELAIKSAMSTGKSINININNINKDYPYYRIAILYYNDSTLADIKLTDRIESINNTYTISSINTLINSSLEEIIISGIKYTRAKSSANNANKLLLYNVTTEDYYYKQFQLVANNIRIDSTGSYKQVSPNNEFPTWTPDEVATEAHFRNSFKSNEPYLFYIRFISNKGDELSINYIPYNSSSNMNEFNLELKYDSEFPELAGQDIKTYRFPKINIIRSAHTYITRYGINVTNVVIPDELKGICAGWEILYAERTLENTRSIGQMLVLGIYSTNLGEYATSAYSFTLQHSQINLSSVSKLERVYRLNLPTGVNLFNHRFTINSGNYLFDYRNYITTSLDSPPNPTHPSFFRPSIDWYFGNVIDTSNFNVMEYRSDHVNETEDKITIIADKIVMPGYYDAIINELPYRGGIANQRLVSTGRVTNKNITAVLQIFGGDISVIDAYHKVTRLSEAFGPPSPHPNDKAISVLYTIESPYHFELRHEGEEEYQKVYPKSDWPVIFNMPKDKGSYINDDLGNSYDLTYSKLNNILNLKLDTNEYEKEFKNRIAVSDVNISESKLLGWRVFKPNSYYDIGFNRGEGVKLISADRNLYIQNRYGLFLAQIKDVLQLADGSQAWLGTADLFDRPPQEIMYDTNGGIGCDDYNSAIYTKFGYIVYDRDNDAIYAVGESVNELTNKGFKDWFRVNTDKFKSDTVTIGFDEIRKRLLINNSNYRLSYNLIVDGLVSFHDDNYIDLYNNRRGTHLITKNTINKYIKSPTSNPSIIDVNIIFEPTVQKLFQAIMWETEYSINGNKKWNETIDKIMVYNDTQCTGLLDVNKGNMWYDNNTGVHKSDRWLFNDFLDAVLNDTEPFLQDFQPNSNVSPSKKNWFDMSQIISKFITVRLHSDNNKGQRIKFLNLFVELTKDPR